MLTFSEHILQQAGILTEDNQARVNANANGYLYSALYFLKESRILTQANFDLVAAHANPYKLASALSCLQKAEILTPENRAMVAAHANPDKLASTLYCLQEERILTPENRAMVANHANPDNLFSALSSLQKAEILTPENRALVAAHTNPINLASALSFLQRSRILTQENFALVAAHTNPINLASALSFLLRSRILTQENFALVANHANPDNLVSVLSSLLRSRILTQENFALVAAHANPVNLASVLSSLQEAGILTPENRALVAAHANPDYLASALSSLQEAGILTPENRALVAAHANPDYLASALSSLRRTGILTQANFDALLAPNHGALVSDQARQLIWSRIPRNLLTQANFERLVAASEEANPMAVLQVVLNQILGVRMQAGHAVAFNPRQSTHTKSVHASVSVSAANLMKSYGDALDLDAKIQEIKVYVNGLADSPINQAAKRCIAQITAADYTFTDSSSRVSTRQLLALAYTAIHDANKCSAKLDIAKALFIEGLYEIQRGGNIDDDQGPEDGRDKVICSSGTFNKLLEKLNGVHSDVKVFYITWVGAVNKFPRLSAAHAITYLQSLSTPATAEDYLRIKELLERLKADVSLEPIWEKIKARVQAELWDEFKEAYGNNPNNEQFIGLINSGQYIELPDLSAIETTLLASPGYQAYIGEQNAPSELAVLSLWTNRHSSSTQSYGSRHQGPL